MLASEALFNHWLYANIADVDVFLHSNIQIS